MNARQYEDSIRDDRNAWAEKFPNCWLCKSRYYLETHEMIRRSKAPKRWAHRGNYFKVCRRCHQDVIPSMPLEAQLAVKLQHDALHFDIEALREMVRLANGKLGFCEVVSGDDVLKAIREQNLQRW